LPVLSCIQPALGTLQFSWPATHPGFTIKQTHSLNPPVVWVPVTFSSTIVEDGSFHVTVPMDSTNCFFALGFDENPVP
jgi:hypothetical protein